MNSLEQLISEDTVHAMAWTVLHSLWQGLLIALVFSLIYYNLKNKTARFKYHLAFASLLAVVLSAACTFVMISDLQTPASAADYSVPSVVVASSDTYQMALNQKTSNWYEASLSYLDNNTNLVVGIWMFGMFLFMIKMLFGIYHVNQVRFSAELIKDKTWQRKIDKYLVNLGSSRSVEIAQSALIKMPMMIGFFKPMILFPIGVINQMDVQEVEAIIAHELSHVLRNDFLMNIIQSIIEVLFYFNPAVWWISSIVRSEREHSCDDMAVELTHSNVHYAKALLRLGYQQNNSNSLVMNFGGKKKKLLLRVQRVLNDSQYKPRVMEKIITSTLLLVLIVGISMGANTTDSPIHTNIEIEDYSVDSDSTNETKQPNEIIEYISIDTLPNQDKSSCQMMYYDGDIRVDVWRENGKVVKLWVDSKRIDEKDFGNYQRYLNDEPDEVVEMMKSVNELRNKEQGLPVPPAPPAPPAPPSPPAPPAPPVKGNGFGLDKLSAEFGDWAGKTEEEMKKYHEERVRILEEMKEISTITFIDSLHPTLKLVETEDGFSYLTLVEDSLKILEGQYNAEAFKLAQMAEALAQQTKELNKTQYEIIHSMESNGPNGDTFISRNVTSAHGDTNSKLNAIFLAELIKDGLLNDATKYNFKLTEDFFKLNGKKLNATVHSKYLSMLKLENDLVDETKIKYTRSVNGRSSSTSLEVCD